MDLVEVKKDEIYCDSHLVARKFNQPHKEVVKRIKKLEEDLSKLRGVSNAPKTIIENREYRSQKYVSYLMNREFFSLLVMRFKGIKALEWQVKFNDAFYQMEKRIFQLEKNQQDVFWIETRKQSKIGRKEETDIIKDFVEYATKQGSTKSQFYYKHITNATYKALGLISQKKPKLRDSMDIYEISELLLAERIAKESMKRYMDLGRNYKDIYESVKLDLISFADNIKVRTKELTK